MPTPARTILLLAALALVVGGLACKKPEPAPAVAPAPVLQPAPAPKSDDAARRKAEAEAEARRQAEAARQAAAAQASAFRAAAGAALKDIHFDYDQADLRDADKAVLQAVAGFLKAWPKAAVRVEGNCDERGTVEYNLALGERRAAAAVAYLAGLGVGRDRLTTISYGKEKPLCTGAGEACWSRNRRDHFTLL